MSKTAIVTGGTRGIGRAIVARLVAEGFIVFATYQRDAASASSLSEQFEDAVVTFQVDGSDLSQVERFCSDIAAYPFPIVLVNNAGIAEDGLFLNQTLSTFKNVMDHNFGGALNFCGTFAPLMARSRQGNIVNVSSVAAQKVKAGNIAYGCAKAALERLTLGLSLEMARFGVRVNCVCPGFVDTEMFRQFAGERVKEILQSVPGRQILSAEEVAEVVCLLATRRISTTGSLLRIGNGENVN